MSMEDLEKDITARHLSREAISRFSLGSKSKYFFPDRIKPLPVLNEEGEPPDPNFDGVGELQPSDLKQPTSKKRSVSEVPGSSKPPSRKKKPRPYAPPETYAHLAHLPDYLKDDLDGTSGFSLWKLTLINVFCSCVLWHKVSHAPHTSIITRLLQRPVQPLVRPQVDTIMLIQRITSGSA